MDDQANHERIARDVNRWRSEGLIDAEQEARILARYDMGDRRTFGALRLGWLVTAIAIIGALVLAAGVVSLFGSTWQQLPVEIRILTLLAGMAAAYAGGNELIERYRMQRVGGAVILLGVLLFGGAVSLLGDFAGIDNESPILMLIGALGTFPVAYFFGSRVVLVLAIAACAGWVIAEIDQQYDGTPEEKASLVIIGVFGIAVYVVGRLHGLREQLARFGDVYTFAGALITLTLVYVFTFAGLWQQMIDDGIQSYSAPAFVYAWIVGTAALISVWLYLRGEDRDALFEAGALAGLLAVAGVVATWPGWVGYAFVFNVIFFGAGAAFISRGYLQQAERYINFGLGIIALGMFTRYCDIFWSLLDPSTFFMLAGAVLLLLALGMERCRRSIIDAMRGDSGDDGPARPEPAPEPTA
jgi:uncharacterized membrane protein